MTQYSVQPREKIFIKGYGFLSFAKNMSTNIGKNATKYLIGKHSQKPLDHAKQSSIDALKTTSKIVIQKTTEATSDLFGDKIADRITKVSKTSAQISLEEF